MKERRQIWLGTALAVLAAAPFSGADQTNSSSLSQAAPWLKLPVSARPAGMGNAFGAVGEDVTALDVNPAGLWRLDSLQVLLSHNTWFQDMSLEQVEVGMPLDRGGLALGVGYADFGSIDSFILGSGGLPQANGSLSPNGLTARTGYGFPFSKNFMAGVMGGYVQQSLGGTTQSTFQAGAGLLLKDLVPRFTLGLSWLNGGGNFSGYSLPAHFKASLAYQSPKIAKDHNFTLAFDGDIPSAGSVLVSGGAEYWYKGFLALRAGDQFSDDLSANGTNGLTLGAGVNLGDLEFDYAFLNNGDLGTSSLFSLDWLIGGRKSLVTEKKILPVEIEAQVVDFKTGSLREAAFSLKPEARTDIKSWTLDINDRQGRLVKSYRGVGIPPARITWDGKDASGNVVSAGIFAVYKLRTVDSRNIEVVSTDTLFRVLKVPEREEEIIDTLKRNVQFDYDKANLVPAFKQQLDQLAAILVRQPQDHVLLVGYSSVEGTEEHNLSLSQKRADGVRGHLLARGVPASQVDTLGKGSTNPLYSNNTEEGRAANRRVEIKVIEVLQGGKEK